MRILKPFIPLRVETQDLCHTVNVAGRSYTFGADGMIKSIVAEGQELLAEPMRLVIVEDGESSVFDDDYPNNESESFIQRRSDEEAVICGCKQSERFIVDFCNTVRYDGNIDIDLKLMTRGKTVSQVFGISDFKELEYKLDKLWLEVPLKREIAQLYHMYPNSNIYLSDSRVIERGATTTGGKLPEIDSHIPFKALLWLGNDEKGLGMFAETLKNRQLEDENKAIEIIYDQDKVILRVRLLDSHPTSWKGEPKNGYNIFKPVEFRFGFTSTPVKSFPKNPYIHKALHIDCGIKIKGNYMDFFAEENRFERLAEKGVDTLILHEKWNKSQNWYELSEYTAKQISYIVDECHKRNIKVLAYFGYELSTMAPVWTELNSKVVCKSENQDTNEGWWRVPFQRDYRVCYNSEYADLFVGGIAKIMDNYNLDGVYLDGTACPYPCYNIGHGCGWYDEKGNLNCTYPVTAIRNMMERLYREVKARDGYINVHCYACNNFTAFPYVDQIWLGENLQFKLNKGSTEDMELDHFRAEYSGRNMGVPAEFIAYENRPFWTFEQALSCSLLFGILPRPNDINFPLELMSGVWKIFDKFPIEKSEWLPYFKNTATTSNEKVKVSYYKYTDLENKPKLLAFAVNISANNIENVTLKFDEEVSTVIDAEKGEPVGFTFNMEPYAYKILYVI